MKIAYASDLHLEFNGVDLIKPDPPVDVLVLAGDIFVAYLIKKKKSCIKFNDFIDKISQEYENIIMIAGNHEHYKGVWSETIDIMKNRLSPYNNIHYLHNEHMNIGNKTFFAGTLWTDMNRMDPIQILNARWAMSDYSAIKENFHGVYRKLGSKTTCDDHESFLKALNGLYTKTENDIIVVSHHAPHEYSVHPKYKNNNLNYYYYSNLQNYIEERPKLKLWIHGHMHDETDYIVPNTNTRVVCNPRGYYGYETKEYSFQPKVVEV